jgi:UDP-2,3-diacylglucosamine hydrolase
MPHSIFVSDLHLCPSRPALTGIFFDLLRGAAADADALYILGDLFEYWAGDDDATEFNQSVIRALSAYSMHGPALYLMHGNRDFLLGKHFVAESGATLLHDPTCVDLHGVPTLLLHGDTLCTDDVRYLAFRAKVRQPAWQAEFLGQTLAARKQIIAGLQAENAEEKQQKSDAIMDVAPAAVEAAFRQHALARMIHGHTHRPAKHTHTVDGKICERWVLADWYQRGSYLRVDGTGCQSFAL